MTLWVGWKKTLKLAITLDTEDVEDARDVGDNTGNKYMKIEMPFYSLMIEFFEGSDTDELMQQTFLRMTIQVKKPQMSKSHFTLDQIMYLHISFRKLVLT